MEQFSGLADSRKVPCSSGNHPVHHIFTRVDLSPSWDHWTSGREPENHSSLLMKKIHGIHHQESKVVPGSIIDSVIKREASLGSQCSCCLQTPWTARGSESELLQQRSRTATRRSKGGQK
ncbi:uncharacterized protein LOC103793609 isoform X2 [Callithrix jacchus]